MEAIETSPLTSSFDVGVMVPIPRLPDAGLNTNPPIVTPSPVVLPVPAT